MTLGTVLAAVNTNLATSGGALTTGTIDATIAGVGSLTIATGAGLATLGDVGGTKALASLTETGAGGVSLRSVTTTGDQSYSGPATLNGTLSATGAGNLTVTSGGAVTLGGDSTLTTAAGTITL